MDSKDEAQPSSSVSNLFPEQKKAIKLLLLGDTSVGKSAFAQRLSAEGTFNPSYTPTSSVSVTVTKIDTDQGEYNFNIWDIPGDRSPFTLRSAYYLCADAAILMLDVTNSSSHTCLKAWYDELRQVCADIPVFVVGNKADSISRVLKQTAIIFPKKNMLPYFDISVKSLLNVNKVMTRVLEKTQGVSNITITSENLPVVQEPAQIHVETNAAQILPAFQFNFAPNQSATTSPFLFSGNTAGSIFSSSATDSAFGSTASSPAFGTTATSTPVFGAATSAPSGFVFGVDTAGSVFSPNTTTAPVQVENQDQKGPSQHEEGE